MAWFFQWSLFFENESKRRLDARDSIKFTPSQFRIQFVLSRNWTGVAFVSQSNMARFKIYLRLNGANSSGKLAVKALAGFNIGPGRYSLTKSQNFAAPVSNTLLFASRTIYKSRFHNKSHPIIAYYYYYCINFYGDS